MMGGSVFFLGGVQDSLQLQTSWWLNQPNWKICRRSNWIMKPYRSGWTSKNHPNHHQVTCELIYNPYRNGRYFNGYLGWLSPLLHRGYNPRCITEAKPKPSRLSDMPPRRSRGIVLWKRRRNTSNPWRKLPEGLRFLSKIPGRSGRKCMQF